jgi:cell division protein FtsI (penicillin-binding protein 3)
MFAVVAFRLVFIQVIKARDFQAEARRQYEVRERLPGTRGDLYDRNGRDLVSSTMGVSFGADPKMIGDQRDEIAGRFARAFGKPRSYYLERLSAKDRHFVWLERRVRAQFSKIIHASDTRALVEIKEPVRLYHYDRLGGQVIGSTDIDNKGLSGIELSLDSYLRGSDGYVVLQRDGHSRTRPSADYPRVEPTVGSSATLTIDIDYQAIAEEELAKGIQRTQSESGLVIILNPTTGEVLGMAHNPPMSPGNPGEENQAVMRNRVITDMFEPGSVYKLVTAAAALERDLVKPTQKFYGEEGTYNVRLVNGSVRNTITDTHPYGTLTFQEAMEVSSNIVMAKVSDRIGSELLYTTGRNFGFGVETGVDLPGEVNGDLKKPSQWSGTTLNSMAYGYEVGVTAIQLACAYAAVANKGVLMKPFIIKKVIDPNGEVMSETQPQIVRRVISAATAKTLTQFFEGVVQRGTAQPARLSGVRVAGKTGTSRKFIDGKYEVGSYTASFIGYFPADDPKVVCLVMLDHPRVAGYTGGQVSAPIFKDIAAKIFAMSGGFTRNPRTVMAAAEGSVVPDVVGLGVDVARELLVRRGFKTELSGSGTVVRVQSPRAGALLPRGSVAKLVTTDHSTAAPGYAVVPDLRGMPIRRALNALAVRQLDAGVDGSGVVASQNPLAGQHVKVGSKVAMRCEPRNRLLLSVN